MRMVVHPLGVLCTMLIYVSARLQDRHRRVRIWLPLGGKDPFWFVKCDFDSNPL